MKDYSKITILEYLISVSWKFALGFIWYKNLLFRILPNRSTLESLKILFIMFGVSIIFFGIVFCYRKTEWISTVSIIFPLGWYTIFTYSKTLKTLIQVVMFVAVGISLVYSILIMGIRVKRMDKKIRRRIYKRRFFRCAYFSVCVVSVTFLFLMVGVGWRKFFGTSLISSSVKAEVVAEEIEFSQTIESNKDMVLKLQPEEWALLNTKERIDVLQTICNIEATYLGLSTAVTVEGDNLSTYTVGTYSDDIHLIRLNLDYIERSSVQKNLWCLLHELYHCYEHRLAEVYNLVAPEFKKLRIFRDASHYAKEVDNYVKPEDDYFDYISQYMEMDSETYAELGVKKYYAQIADWLTNNEQDEK